MGRFASGRKSFGTSDITGFRVRYPRLKTTWNNLRVEPEEFDIKHPQLTPAKNIFDATALRDPRPENDKEITNVPLGFSFDIFADRQDRTSVGVEARGGVGIVETDFLITEDVQEGVEGTFSIGDIILDSEIGETGVFGSSAVGGVFAGTYSYIVTVVSGNPSNHPYYNQGSTNKYAINGSTDSSDVVLSLVEGQTYRFDQSDSSNDGHPINIYEDVDKSTRYTSGVSYYIDGSSVGQSSYSDTSTFNAGSDRYVEFTVPTGAPTLFYQCYVHAKMGATINTPAVSTAVIQVEVIATQLTLTGSVGDQSMEGSPTGTQVSATGSVGDGTSVPVSIGGWGQRGWGEDTWGL